MEMARRPNIMRNIFPILCCVALAHGHAQRASTRAPGFTYTLTVTAESPASRPGITGGAGSQNYVGNASVLGSRGRLDIVDGGIPELFAKGDYLLFDSTEVVIVHP